MKNKVLIITAIVLILAVGIGIGIYLSRSGEESSRKKEVRLEKEGFSINVPAGWSETGAPTGISAMVVNTSEEITDPAAQKINFRSYFSVIYDVLGGKTMEEYIQSVKDSLSESIPDIIISHGESGTVDNQYAYFMEAEFNQKNIDFKILLTIVKSEEQDVWIVSFNTVLSNWNNYKSLFYQIAKSFKIK